MRKFMNKELRKQQNHLVDAGTGVVLFAVWSVAKMNLFLALSPKFSEELEKGMELLGMDADWILAVIAAIFVIILLWQLVVRLYIGICATAEGKGKPKGYAYLVVTAILLVTDFQTNWQTFGVERILAGEKMSVDLITGICMELASMYVFVTLLISGIRVKMLKRKMKE